MKIAGSRAQGLAALWIAGALSGCATAGVPVSGARQGNTQDFDQSETAVNVSNFAAKSVITVAYNDGTDGGSTVQYTSTTRKVLAGASLLGWSYSTDRGQSWKYGGKVSPPSGWAALWGDPAITRAHLDQRYVFISNLAIPQEKFPAGGINGAVNNYLGGACIVRSVDGGVTFQNYQCVHNNHHFYDGGSMAAGIDGKIYASFVDIDTQQIDVWMSPGHSGTFTLLPPPFPRMEMWSHPRLRMDVYSGVLYVAAQRVDGVIFVNRYQGGGWGAPVPASFQAALYPSIKLSDRDLRTGPQFSFDVGAESGHANDAVRFVYTIWDARSKRYYVRGSFCPRDLSECKDAPEWGTTPGNLNLSGDQFNPIVRAFPGFIGLDPAWKVSYLSRQKDPAGNTVSIYQGNLAVLPNGSRILLPFTLVGSHLVCPDLRGYWGDYDDMQLVGFTESLSAIFLRAFSDSSQGCSKRWEFTSHHLHVSSAIIE
jgi:hypothetical protein